MSEHRRHLLHEVLSRRPRLAGDERGIVMILAIFLLAIMSILGALLLSNSTSEIQLSGNYRLGQEAFYAADRAVEYAYGILPDPNPFDPPVSLYDHATDGALHRERIREGRSGLEPSTPSDTRNTIEYLGPRSPGVGSGNSVGNFQEEVFAIRALGASPLGSPNPARSDIRSQVGKLVPK